MEFAKKYSVYINDKPAQLEKIRVSLYPFNRHWPGFQRPLDQTEVTAFASFDLKGETCIRVECEFDFEEVIIRPLSLNIQPEISGRTVSFTIKKPCQTVVEFDGTFGALHLFADPPEKCEIPAENILYFGKGEHDVGTINLQSGQTVYIDEGATVYGQIYGIDVENVKILGKGILDHSRIEAENLPMGTEVVDPIRPSPILIEYGKNIVIKDIVIRDALFLAVRPVCCEDVHIDNIKIIGNWRYNSDGIDLLNCRRALVENCFVRSFDDAYCIKGFCFPVFNGQDHHGGKVYDIGEDIIFRNCVAFNDWGKAFEVGVDLCATEVRNCRFENCDVIHAVAPALEVCNVDYSYVHDIVFDNIRVEYCKTSPEPIIQETEEQLYTGLDSDYMPPLMCAEVVYNYCYSSPGERGRVENITFNNIQVTAPRMPMSTFGGFDSEHGVKNVKVSELYLNGKKIETMDEANFEIRPFADNIILE